MSITNTLMTSTETAHRAEWRPDAAADGTGAWVVSWLPGRLFDRNQAITAVTLAETIGRAVHPYDDDAWWAHVEDWCAELDISADQAIQRLGV